MKLRKLTPKDDKKVVALVKATMGKEVGHHCELAFKDAENQGTDKRCLWGFFERDRLVAIGGIYDGFWDKSKAYISWFSVAENYQRTGIGTLMIKHVEEEAKKDGRKWLYVETYDNEQFRKANNFYRKMGYRFAGSLKNYLNDGSDAIYYYKELSDEDT